MPDAISEHDSKAPNYDADHSLAYSSRAARRERRPMIPDLDIWRSAMVMVKRYGDDRPS